MSEEFTVDARDLNELVVKLRRAGQDSRSEVDKGLAAVGEAHKLKAKAILNGHSSSIPPTIHVEVLPGAHAVRLTAAGTALAWAYERGNKDNRRGKTFLHPVFGRDDIDPVPQQRYPFFSRARSQLRLWTLKTLTDAARTALRKSGIKLED